MEAQHTMNHPMYAPFVMLLCSIICTVVSLWIFVEKNLDRLRGKPPESPARRPTSEHAYLVIHFNIKVSPPVATFVCIYSASARHLTNAGTGEAKADIYKVSAPTFAEAHAEMQRIAPLYFPWVTPLMRRP